MLQKTRIVKMKNQDELWKDYQNDKSNIKARNAIVMYYMPSVKMIAKKMFKKLGGNADLDDLISDGTIGLIDCIEKFEPNRKCRFTTYCFPRIQGAMIDALRKLDWVPRNVRRQQKTNPNISIINTISLYDTIKEDMKPLDFVSCKCNKPSNRILRISQLQNMLKGLSQTERFIIILYYYNNETMETIGRTLNITKSRVSQIHEAVINKMKTPKNRNQNND
jgi:RNA polymerase sigma factor for flagellar operon FliA